jgi:radical SAM protein with 4Fe4S-binding SPASM domain
MPGVQAVLGMTLSSENYDRLDETVAAVRRRCGHVGYRDFHVNLAQTSAHYYDNVELGVDAVPPEDLRRAVRRYRRRRGISLSPVAFLEHEYLRRVDAFLRTGRTPVRCHALRSSCWIDPAGDVYPCSMYGKVVGNLREADYDLGRIWESEGCRALQQEIWRFRCPQCWTPCEAYQSLLGSFLRLRR